MYEQIKLWWHCKVKGARKIRISSIFGTHLSYTYDGVCAPYGLYTNTLINLMPNGFAYFNYSHVAHMKWSYV